MTNRFAAATAAAVMVISAAAVPAMAETSRPGKSITIRADAGGQVLDYALRIKRIEKNGNTVRFEGRCDSACTLHLALPSSQTCLMPGASFGFHMPYGSNRRGNTKAAIYMAKKYPEWVLSWLSAHGGLTGSMKRMPYSYASHYLPKCPTTTARVWF